ncbi:hypothetical protein B0H12DRAFT_1067228 [Mycena haematopus]|nr:hypothetical protein B0H12DRAFT_1067228 [Mycena haematopus]
MSSLVTHPMHLADSDVRGVQKNRYSTESTSIFEDSGKEKNATDLLNWTPDESGYISGKITMSWPSTLGKYRIIVLSGIQEYEVVFSGPCAGEFSHRNFAFKIGSELRLSLRGVTVTRPRFPGSKIVLRYCDGAALKLLPHDQAPGCTIDSIDVHIMTCGQTPIHRETNDFLSRVQPFALDTDNLEPSNASISVPHSTITQPILDGIQPGHQRRTAGSGSGSSVRWTQDTSKSSLCVPFTASISADYSSPSRVVTSGLMSHTELDFATELKLIAQAQSPDPINCIVELLHADESRQAIYVTDYTPHPEIPSIQQVWANELDGYVLEIVLSDEQAQALQPFIVGHFYVILSLRFSRSMAGSVIRIHPIEDDSGFLEDWKYGIIWRKNNLERGAPVVQIRTHTELMTTGSPLSAQLQNPSISSIRQVLACTECPKTFIVRARVVDFFPLSLEDSFVEACGYCRALIPQEKSVCSCGRDFAPKILSILRLMIDDGDGRLKISLSGNIPLLNAVKPCLLRHDAEAAKQFSAHMKPLLGNLQAVHDAISREESVEPSGSVMTLVIDSWKADDNTAVYGLCDFAS